MGSPHGVVALENALQSPPVDLSLPIPYSQLRNKTILITGGASGIGAAIAARLAHHGANVVIGDVNERQGTDLVATLRTTSTHHDHHFLPLDVSDWGSQVAFFRAAADRSPHGGIDCVIANAGINDSSESEAFEINVPRFSTIAAPPPPRLKTLRVDLDGVLYTTTLALSYLSENPASQKCSLHAASPSRDRHLLLVSSIAGTSALPASSIYAAAKHGIVGLFRSLRISAPILHGVRVNMLCPQYVATPILGPKAMGVLVGTPKTEMDDVVEAAARLVADQHVIGRALLIGTPTTPDQIQRAGLDSTPGRHDRGAIWDISGHDFEQADLLVRRTVSLLNLAAQARGWSALASDCYHLILGVAVEIGLLVSRLLFRSS